MEVDSGGFVGVISLEHNFELQFLEEGYGFQILEFVFVDLDDDGDVHWAGEGVSGLEAHLLLGFAQVVDFCDRGWCTLDDAFDLEGLGEDGL